MSTPKAAPPENARHPNSSIAPRYDHLAKPLSESARYRYSAAMSLWVETLLKSGADLPQGTELADLFSSDLVDSMLGRWSSAKTHAARTHYKYITDLAALLARHGLTEEASYVAGLTKILSFLKEGRAAEKSMGPKVRRWCERLMRDPQKVALFDSQHYEYLRLALEVRIPRACGHRFHEHVATDSTMMWPPIPRHVATLIR